MYRDLNLEDLLTKNASYDKSCYAIFQTPPKSNVQRNGTVTLLKAANHPLLSEKQVDLPVLQLKWKKTSR